MQDTLQGEPASDTLQGGMHNTLQDGRQVSCEPAPDTLRGGMADKPTVNLPMTLSEVAWQTSLL